MTAPFRGSGPWRGRGPFLGRGPWAGKAPFGFNAGLPFAINATGAQLRDALATPSAWGETLGPELVSNGGFDSATGWTTLGGSVSITGGQVVSTTATGIVRPSTPALLVGRSYRAVFSYTMSGGVALRIESASTILATSATLAASGTVTLNFVANTTNFDIAASGLAFTGTIDNFSVREVVTGWLLPGLGGARLSGDCRTSVAMQTEADGTVGYAAHNFMGTSQAFSGGNWTAAANVTLTDNAVASPKGDMTAASVSWASASTSTGFYRVATGINGAANTKSIWMRADVAGGTVELTDASNTVGITTHTLTTTWARVSLSEAAGAQPSNASIWIRKTASSPATFYVWGAQLNLGPTALPYVPTTTAARFGPAIDWLSGIGAYGIRSEAARTNLVTYSTDLSNAAWTKSAAAVTQDGPTSPLGIASSKITASGLGGRAVQTVTATSTSHTFWALLKRENRTVNRLMIYNNTTAAVVGEIEFNLQTGVVEAQTVATGAIAALGTGGWYLCEVRVSSGITVGNSIIGYVYCGTGTIANGDIVYCGHAQLEAGTEASSPILTYAAAATRAADTLDVLDSGWMNAAEGTVAMEWVIPNTTGTRTAWHLTDGGSNERMIVQANAGGTTRHLTFIGGSAVVALDIGSAPAGVRVRDAFTYKAGRYAASRGGSAPITSAHASVPAAANVLRLGHDQTTNHLGGHITALKVSRRAATNPLVQGLLA